MLTAKELLLKQTHEAFGGSDEMSLKSSLWKLTPEEAAWKMGPRVPTIEQKIRHVADCKLRYCHQAFGTPPIPVPSDCGNLPEALVLLEQAQQLLMRCLNDCPDDSLSKPVTTDFHGESAANLFWILLMHDIWHAGQIRTRRTAYANRPQ